MNIVEKTISDIKSIKIQGAINIAMKALFAVYKYSLTKNINYNDIQIVINRLKNTRPTEPAMQNLLNIFFNKIKNINLDDKKKIDSIYEDLLMYINKETDDIINYGVNFLLSYKKKELNIFTHCHSSTVIKIILKAFKEGKKINVYNTEARPKYQGRKTAYELTKSGIQVFHTIDNGAHYFIKKCDMFLFGADAIDFDKTLYNKVGTYTYCLLAKKFNIKTFSCTGSLKYNINSEKNINTIIEQRNIDEIWDKNSNIKRPNKNLSVFNPAFDSIPCDLIDGIICNFGVIKIDKYIQLSSKIIKNFLKYK